MQLIKPINDPQNLEKVPKPFTDGEKKEHGRNSLKYLGLGQSQDFTFFYKGSHLSELQSYALLLSINFHFIFIFK